MSDASSAVDFPAKFIEIFGCAVIAATPTLIE